MYQISKNKKDSSMVKYQRTKKIHFIINTRDGKRFNNEEISIDKKDLL